MKQKRRDAETQSPPPTKPPRLLGKEARWDGKAEEDNPFIPDDWPASNTGFPNESAEQWHEGYTEAKEEEEEGEAHD